MTAPRAARWCNKDAAQPHVALAFGIGLATIGFTLREAILYGQLPSANGDRLLATYSLRSAPAPRLGPLLT